MIKKNKILIGCLSLLLVLSVGYALFSETIAINGTATAKGSFSFSSTCTGGIPNDVRTSLLSDGRIIYTEGAYENDICTVEGKTITATVDLMYPTARRFFTAEIKNTGTIDAVFNINTVSSTYTITTSLYKRTDDTLIKTEYDDSFRVESMLIRLKNGTVIHEDVDLNSNSLGYTNTAGEYVLKIPSGASFIIVLEAVWDSSYVSSEYYPVSKVHFDIPLVQMTSDLTPVVLEDFCLAGC